MKSVRMKKSNNDAHHLNLIKEDLLHQWELFCPCRTFPIHSTRYFLDQIIIAAKTMHQDYLKSVVSIGADVSLDPTTEILATEHGLYYLMDRLDDLLNLCQNYSFPKYQQKRIQQLLQKVQKTFWATEVFYYRSIEGESYKDNLMIQSLITTGGSVYLRAYVSKKRFLPKLRLRKQDLN
jgi:hypothetical protein